MSENQDFQSFESNNDTLNAPSGNQQYDTQNPSQAPGMSTNNASGGGNNGDALDKGVDFLERKFGHEQVCEAETEIPGRSNSC